jgi:DNA-directed RNA polymerase subunit RPC12/RpoP
VTTPSLSTKLTCTQCGGELHPDEGQIFVTCPYCSSTVYLDKSKVVFHWYLAPTMDESQARSELARWMTGNETVKDLDNKSRLLGQAFQFFPVWYLKSRSGMREHVFIEPASATSVTELRSLTLPVGDLRKYDDSIKGQTIEPTVPLNAAIGWLVERGIAENEIAESALVHIPIYTFKYGYRNEAYTAVVEGATGTVLANIFPAKAEAPYLAVGGVSAAVFLCLAGVLAGGLLSFNGAYFGLAALACVIGGIIAAGALFAVAGWVAAKV